MKKQLSKISILTLLMFGLFLGLKAQSSDTLFIFKVNLSAKNGEFRFDKTQKSKLKIYKHYISGDSLEFQKGVENELFIKYPSLAKGDYIEINKENSKQLVSISVHHPNYTSEIEAKQSYSFFHDKAGNTDSTTVLCRSVFFVRLTPKADAQLDFDYVYKNYYGYRYDGFSGVLLTKQLSLQETQDFCEKYSVQIVKTKGLKVLIRHSNCKNNCKREDILSNPLVADVGPVLDTSKIHFLSSIVKLENFSNRNIRNKGWNKVEDLVGVGGKKGGYSCRDCHSGYYVNKVGFDYSIFNEIERINFKEERAFKKKQKSTDYDKELQKLKSKISHLEESPSKENKEQIRKLRIEMSMLSSEKRRTTGGRVSLIIVTGQSVLKNR